MNREAGFTQSRPCKSLIQTLKERENVLCKGKVTYSTLALLTTSLTLNASSCDPPPSLRAQWSYSYASSCYLSLVALLLTFLWSPQVTLVWASPSPSVGTLPCLVLPFLLSLSTSKPYCLHEGRPLVSYHITTRRHNQEHDVNPHHRENLKPRIMVYTEHYM
jgi:hypothetical protein